MPLVTSHSLTEPAASCDGKSRHSSGISIIKIAPKRHMLVEFTKQYIIQLPLSGYAFYYLKFHAAQLPELQKW